MLPVRLTSPQKIATRAKNKTEVAPGDIKRKKLFGFNKSNCCKEIFLRVLFLLKL
jgi:hypothetical protein